MMISARCHNNLLDGPTQTESKIEIILDVYVYPHSDYDRR